MFGGRRGGGGMVGLLLLQALSEYGRLDRKLPVTASLIAANTLIYLRPKFLDPALPTLNQVCFNPQLILKNKDLKRLLLSAFYHTGEPHLFYNMLSLLWKGIQLESRMGSVEFASMVAALLGMSQGITLLLAKALLLLDYNSPYYDEYSVGFSGVLFAMKVVLYSQSDSYAYVHGVMVPARYAAWAELILIQMFVPGVSFLGHLGGILAGIAYLYLTASHSAAHNPFTKVVRAFSDVILGSRSQDPASVPVGLVTMVQTSDLKTSSTVEPVPSTVRGSTGPIGSTGVQPEKQKLTYFKYKLIPYSL